MSDDARAFEKAGWTNAFGAIDDLGGERKVARGDFVAKGADGAEGEDGTDAEMFESGDVRAGRDGGGGDVVVFAVARDEGDTCTRREGADGDRGRGVSPGLV